MTERNPLHTNTSAPPELPDHHQGDDHDDKGQRDFEAVRTVAARMPDVPTMTDEQLIRFGDELIGKARRLYARLSAAAAELCEAEEPR